MKYKRGDIFEVLETHCIKECSFFIFISDSTVCGNSEAIRLDYKEISIHARPPGWKKKISGNYWYTSSHSNQTHSRPIVNYFKLKEKKKVLNMLASQDLSIRKFCKDCLKSGTIK